MIISRDGENIWVGDEEMMEELRGKRQRNIQRDGEQRKYQKAIHLLEVDRKKVKRQETMRKRIKRERTKMGRKDRGV